MVKVHRPLESKRSGLTYWLDNENGITENDIGGTFPGK
jgi:hypothetical protein